MTGTPGLPFDETAVMANAFNNDSKSLFEASQYLEHLEGSDPALFHMISDAAKELSAMEGAQYFFCSSAQPTRQVSDVKKPSSDSVTFQVPTVYLDSRTLRTCAGCGKLHDRKARVLACINTHLGCKPYQCHGECGERNWSVTPILHSLDSYIPQHEGICFRRAP